MCIFRYRSPFIDVPTATACLEGQAGHSSHFSADDALVMVLAAAVACTAATQVSATAEVGTTAEVSATTEVGATATKMSVTTVVTAQLLVATDAPHSSDTSLHRTLGTAQLQLSATNSQTHGASTRGRLGLVQAGSAATDVSLQSTSLAANLLQNASSAGTAGTATSTTQAALQGTLGLLGGLAQAATEGLGLAAQLALATTEGTGLLKRAHTTAEAADAMLVLAGRQTLLEPLQLTLASNSLDSTARASRLSKDDTNLASALSSSAIAQTASTAQHHSLTLQDHLATLDITTASSQLASDFASALGRCTTGTALEVLNAASLADDTASGATALVGSNADLASLAGSAFTAHNAQSTATADLLLTTTASNAELALTGNLTHTLAQSTLAALDSATQSTFASDRLGLLGTAASASQLALNGSSVALVSADRQTLAQVALDALPFAKLSGSASAPFGLAAEQTATAAGLLAQLAQSTALAERA